MGTKRKRHNQPTDAEGEARAAECEKAAEAQDVDRALDRQLEEEMLRILRARKAGATC
jgi:hypothetical protein